jgi:hypothetical protein
LNGVGGRTVAEAKERMSRSEFEAWAAFYQMYPFDDLHRYHRPAVAVAASFGGKADQLMEYLAPEPVPPGMTAADFQTMRAMRKLMG